MRPKDSSQQLGQTGEEIACHYLEKKGYKILVRRFRHHRSEIDIIARQGETIVFIEVKTRRHNQYGFPEEAVDTTKQAKIKASALGFLAQRKERFANYRFDVLSIILHPSGKYEITHFRDAF